MEKGIQWKLGIQDIRPTKVKVMSQEYEAADSAFVY